MKGDHGPVEVIGDDGKPAFQLPAEAYWELLGATEKYIALLNSQSADRLTDEECAAVDDFTFFSGITVGGAPAAVRLTRTHFALDVHGGISGEVHFLDVKTCAAGPDGLRVESWVIREDPAAPGASPVVATIEKLVRLRKRAFQSCSSGFTVETAYRRTGGGVGGSRTPLNALQANAVLPREAHAAFKKACPPPAAGDAPPNATASESSILSPLSDTQGNVRSPSFAPDDPAQRHARVPPAATPSPLPVLNGASSASGRGARRQAGPHVNPPPLRHQSSPSFAAPGVGPPGVAASHHSGVESACLRSAVSCMSSGAPSHGYHAAVSHGLPSGSCDTCHANPGFADLPHAGSRGAPQNVPRASPGGVSKVHPGIACPHALPERPPVSWPSFARPADPGSRGPSEHAAPASCATCGQPAAGESVHFPARLVVGESAQFPAHRFPAQPAAGGESAQFPAQHFPTQPVAGESVHFPAQPAAGGESAQFPAQHFPTQPVAGESVHFPVQPAAGGERVHFPAQPAARRVPAHSGAFADEPGAGPDPSQRGVPSGARKGPTCEQCASGAFRGEAACPTCLSAEGIGRRQASHEHADHRFPGQGDGEGARHLDSPGALQVQELSGPTRGKEAEVDPPCNLPASRRQSRSASRTTRPFSLSPNSTVSGLPYHAGSGTRSPAHRDPLASPATSHGRRSPVHGSPTAAPPPAGGFPHPPHPSLAGATNSNSSSVPEPFPSTSPNPARDVPGEAATPSPQRSDFSAKARATHRDQLRPQAAGEANKPTQPADRREVPVTEEANRARSGNQTRPVPGSSAGAPGSVSRSCAATVPPTDAVTNLARFARGAELPRGGQTAAAPDADSERALLPLIPLTKNVSDPAELEGLSFLVANISPHSTALPLQLVASATDATVVPMQETLARMDAVRGSNQGTDDQDVQRVVVLDRLIPAGEEAVICGFDPRMNRAKKQSFELSWRDDNAKVAVAFRNAAPYRVTVTADYRACADLATVAPLSAGGPTPRGPRHTLSAVVLPGETVSLFQLTSTGKTSLRPVCAFFCSFDALSLEQQLSYLLPIAKIPCEPAYFALQKLVCDYTFDVEAAHRYMVVRLGTEIDCVRMLRCSEIERRQLAEGPDAILELRETDVIDLCVSNGIAYSDVDFVEVMVGDELPPGCVLKRPQQFSNVHKVPVAVMSERPSADVGAGALAHKWWVTAARALADRPSLLSQCLAEYDLPAGHFTAHVCTSGWWLDITCDTWIPCDADGPAHASSPSSELWVQMLEKVSAWLAGGYGNLRQGTVGSALALFTGAPYHRISLAHSDLCVDTVWEEMKDWLSQGCLVCIAAEGIEPTPGVSEEEAEGFEVREDVGLLPSASVLNAVDYEGRRLVRLRGECPWRVPWGWSDPVWKTMKTPTISSQADLYGKIIPSGVSLPVPSPVLDREQGVTWMELGDVLARYASLTVAHVREHWGDLRMHGEILGKSCDFVVELHVESTTQAVIQLQPTQPGVTPTLGLSVLRLHDDPACGYEAVVLVPSPSSPPTTKQDPPLAIELTLDASSKYIVIPSRVDGAHAPSECTQFVLSIQTELRDCGWGYLKKVNTCDVGDYFYAPVCRQGRGQDAKPVPTGEQGLTSVWWREDSSVPTGMVLENNSTRWTWHCQMRLACSDREIVQISLPPLSKRHVFPELAGDLALYYDHFVHIYHTTTYSATPADPQAEGFDYNTSHVSLPTVERPVQKDGECKIHSWHTLRL
ncbi:Calpain-D [Diplonema papillatum]|nr:Calpain-D [Diplonema papillatum]